MRRNLAASLVAALVCLWVFPFAAAASVEFAVAKKDIESHWKKSFSTETILEVKSAGEGTSSVKVINLKKIPYFSVPARVKVKRADGSVATFSVSAIYKKPGAKWLFEDVGTGNVEQEKVSGQDPPPASEAEALIAKGWSDKFASEGDTDIKILKVHASPAFKAYGQRFWYRYKIDLEYTSGNMRYACTGQEVDLVKENASASWVFKAMKNAAVCEGKNLK